jgi:hypothetical protein
MKKSMLFANLMILCIMTFVWVSCGPTSPKAFVGITSPVAGQKALAGDTLLVTWTQSVVSPAIFYDYNFGAGWQQFASVIPIDDFSAKVVLPVASYSDSFQVKVQDNNSTTNAWTSAFFSLKYIIIIFPAAKDTFKVGQKVTITWKDFPARLSSINITLSTDGGKSGLINGEIVSQSISDLSVKSYSWVIGSEPGSGAPFSYPSSQCILRVSDYVNNALFDDSGTFRVQ